MGVLWAAVTVVVNPRLFPYRRTPEPGEPAGRLEVKARFAYLLDREPKESILPSFELAVLERYVPEYEAEIGGYL